MQVLCAFFFFLSLDRKAVHFMIHLYKDYLVWWYWKWCIEDTGCDAIKIKDCDVIKVVIDCSRCVISDMLSMIGCISHLWLVDFNVCDIRCDWLEFFPDQWLVAWFYGCDVNHCPVIGWFQGVTWNLQCGWLLTPCDWVDKCWVGGSRLWTLLFRFGDFCIAFCKLQP